MQEAYWRQDHNFLSPWTCLNCTVKEWISPWIFPPSQTVQGTGLRNSRGCWTLQFAQYSDLWNTRTWNIWNTLPGKSTNPIVLWGGPSLKHVSPVKLHFRLRLGTISGAGLRGRRVHFPSALQGEMLSILCFLYTCGLEATQHTLALSHIVPWIRQLVCEWELHSALEFCSDGFPATEKPL